MKTLFTVSALAVILSGGIRTAQADVSLTIDPGAAWLGYMNVFELPANGGGFVFGSGWQPADLPATFSGSTLTLAPNSINDPSTFWYIGGGGPGAQGNKVMEGSMYVEPAAGSLSGQTVTFSANVLSNTLIDPYTSVAFIKDFAPNYSSFVEVSVPLVNGVFSISLETIADPTRHVQYGFTTKGPNVWITDVAPFGTVQIAPVPEPASLSVLAGGLLTLLGFRRPRAHHVAR